MRLTLKGSVSGTAQLGEQLLRFFFRNEVTALQGAAAHVGGDFALVG